MLQAGLPEPSSVDFIPLFEAEQLRDVFFKPSPPVVRCSIRLLNSSQPRRLGPVRLKLSIIAEMKTFTPPPKGETPPPAVITPRQPLPGTSLPPDLIFGEILLPTPDVSDLPTLKGPEQSDVPPLELAFSPDEVGLPQMLIPDQETELSFDFSHPKVMAYFRQHPNAVHMKATIQPTDELERAFINAAGLSVELEATVRVL